MPWSVQQVHHTIDKALKQELKAVFCPWHFTFQHDLWRIMSLVEGKTGTHNCWLKCWSFGAQTACCLAWARWGSTCQWRLVTAVIPLVMKELKRVSSFKTLGAAAYRQRWAPWGKWHIHTRTPCLVSAVTSNSTHQVRPHTFQHLEARQYTLTSQYCTWLTDTACIWIASTWLTGKPSTSPDTWDYRYKNSH